MTSGLSDRVDCAHLADDAAELERTYPLSELPRLKDMLEDARGTLRARFSFVHRADSRSGVRVWVEAAPRLVCQRCLRGFAFPVVGESEIEFASSEAAAPIDSPYEIFVMQDGTVSLCELAEEELLLAIPIVAACSTPQTCGRAPQAVPDERTRPFSGLQDLLKKT